MVTKLLILVLLVAFCVSASISSPVVLGKDELSKTKVQVEMMQKDQPAEAAMEQVPRSKRKACTVFCSDTDKVITVNNHYTKVYTQAPPRSGDTTNLIQVGK